MTDQIKMAIKDLQLSNYAWDLDELMDQDYIEAHPLYKLIDAIHLYDKVILYFLLYNSLLRVLPCWEVTCLEKRPRQILMALKRFLRDQNNGDLVLLDYSQRTEPCVYDSGHCELEAASDAIANAVLYVLKKHPEYAAFSVSMVEISFEHIFIDDGFEQWFFDYAIPISFEKRYMTLNELSKFAIDDYSIIAYENIYLALCS